MTPSYNESGSLHIPKVADWPRPNPHLCGSDRPTVPRSGMALPLPGDGAAPPLAVLNALLQLSLLLAAPCGPQRPSTHLESGTSWVLEGMSPWHAASSDTRPRPLPAAGATSERPLLWEVFLCICPSALRRVMGRAGACIWGWGRGLLPEAEAGRNVAASSPQKIRLAVGLPADLSSGFWLLLALLAPQAAGPGALATHIPGVCHFIPGRAALPDRIGI